MRSVPRRAVVAGIAGLLLICVSAPAAPDAVWTPEQGWQKAGPAADVKGGKDFEKAFSLYLSGKYSRAAKLFEKVVKEGDKSLNEEASVLLAESYLGGREYRSAFKQYEKFLKDYPASRFADRAMQGEVDIARAALAGARVRYIGLKVWSGYGLGEKVVDKITSRRPFSDYAREAQMALADSYFRRRLYIESGSAYRQYLELFGESPGSSDALLGVGRSFYLDAPGPGYDPVPYYKASSVADELTREQPGSPQAAEAAKLRVKAEDALAEHYYSIGRWYVKMKHPEAALPYFNKVLTGYRETRWAEKSRAAIDRLPPEIRGGNGA